MDNKVDMDNKPKPELVKELKTEKVELPKHLQPKKVVRIVVLENVNTPTPVCSCVYRKALTYNVIPREAEWLIKERYAYREGDPVPMCRSEWDKEQARIKEEKRQEEQRVALEKARAKTQKEKEEKAKKEKAAEDKKIKEVQEKIQREREAELKILEEEIELRRLSLIKARKEKQGGK